MKLTALAFLLAGFAMPASRALGQSLARTTSVEAQAVLHTDGTRSDRVKDITKHEMNETTYDGRGVVIAKKVFLLNENGDPVQGVIYDGAGNLIARVQFYFDDLNRLVEERCVNTQGQVFRQVVHRYDASGNPLPAEAHDWQVNAPNMRPSKVDFTNSPKQAPRQQSKTPAQPGQTPQIQSVSPRTGEAFSNDPGQQPQGTGMQGTVPTGEKKDKKPSKLNPLNWFKKKESNP